MDEHRRIVVYGRSIVLGALEASLRLHPQFEVIVLTPPVTAEELAGLAPQAILFDAAADCPDLTLALLRMCPGVELIAIDPDRNVASVWCRQQLHELSTQDLISLIDPPNPMSFAPASRRARSAHEGE